MNWLEQAPFFFFSMALINQYIPTKTPTAGPAHKPLLLLGNGASELIDLVVRQATHGCVRNTKHVMYGVVLYGMHQFVQQVPTWRWLDSLTPYPYPCTHPSLTQ